MELPSSRRTRAYRAGRGRSGNGWRKSSGARSSAEAGGSGCGCARPVVTRRFSPSIWRSAAAKVCAVEPASVSAGNGRRAFGSIDTVNARVLISGASDARPAGERESKIRTTSVIRCAARSARAFNSRLARSLSRIARPKVWAAISPATSTMTIRPNRLRGSRDVKAQSPPEPQARSRRCAPS